MKVTLILGDNFMDLTIPNIRELTVKIEICRINNLKTCTYPIHKIIQKNYQITSKTYGIKYGQTMTLNKL